MTLASPQFLWGLLLLPFLWWLSQPPRPRHSILTAHMQQWQLAMRSLRRRPPRGSWLRFALLALATVGATIAACQPFIKAGDGAKRLVVLLDASTSMAANIGTASGKHSAFDQAKQQLSAKFATLPPHIELTVLRCGGSLLRRHGQSARELQDLGEAMGDLQVDLVALAEQTVSPECAVWTLTDGQGQSQLPSVGALSHFDAQCDNAAIAAVRVIDRWPLPAMQLEIDVVAFAMSPETVNASLSVRGAIVTDQIISCDLQYGVTKTMTIDMLRASQGGELRIDLQLPGDRLAVDNVHILNLPALPAPRIAVLAESELGTFAAVAASALAEEVGGKVVPIESGASVGMVLVDGGFMPLQGEDGQVAKRRALTFGTRLREPSDPEVWREPSPIDWSRDSSLTVGLDLSELRIDQAWRGILPAGEIFLWCLERGERVPLGVLVDGGDTASVHFAFRLEDSNLPLLAAFPQLLRRSFVRSYGQPVASIASPSLSPVAERNLTLSVEGNDRDLPQFAAVDRGLARWFVLLGLLALSLRAFVR